MGSGGSARAQTRAGWGNLVLRETDLGNVSTWCSLVESRHHRKLNVAASRLLRAVRERDQPDDALVDAVISLEALFGVGEVSETTFRVSAACARLLEADLAKRQEVRKRSRTLTVRGVASFTVHSWKHKTSSATEMLP